MKRKHRVLEQIEKDREGHKALREACWSRPVGEQNEDEFLTIFHQSAPISAKQIHIFNLHANEYLNMNNISISSTENVAELTSKRSKIHQPEGGVVEEQSKSKKPVAEDDLPILVLDLESVLAPFFIMKKSPNHKISKLASTLYDLVHEVAKRAFFYRDLRKFEQVTVDYYQGEEDPSIVAKLDHYDFGNDSLARHPDHVEGKYYGERSYRYRMSARRYDIRSMFYRTSNLFLLQNNNPFIRNYSKVT